MANNNLWLTSIILPDNLNSGIIFNVCNKFSTKQFQIAVTLIICLLAFSARVIPGPRTIDDSYITYRYARNLLSGNGFTYNPGESILGTTTPLYTLLMAGAGSVLGGDKANFPNIALYINALADSLTCLLIILVSRNIKSTHAGYGASLVWAIAPYSVTFSIGGLETSLYVLLLTLTAWALITQKTTILCLSASLSLLTRPDAVILLVPIALYWGYQLLTKKSRICLRDVLTFLVPVILWYGFAWLQFGSPFPHSVQAKLVAYRLEPFSALIRLLQHYATPFLEHELFGNKWIAVGLLLNPVLFIVGAKRAFKSIPAILPWTLYPWLYIIIFSIPNPLIFRWYLTPPLPALMFFVLLGLETTAQKLLGLATRNNALRNTFSSILVVLIPFLLTAQGWQLSPDHGNKTPAPEMAWYKLEELYQKAALLIAPQMDSKTVLAAGDVGVLGYYTPAKILDTVGLNSEQSLNYYPLNEKYYVINYAISPDLIIDEKPDWLVMLEVYGRNGLLKDERFLTNYSLFQKFETDIYGSDGMLIFQCDTCRNE